MNEPMTLSLAWDIIGGLSEPSKMPCYSFSIPATACKTGAKLRNVQGTVCNMCYALKGRYSFGIVKAALIRRFNNLQHPRWVEAMAFLINKKEKSGFFRLFDSGDIQDEAMLDKIVEVCKLTPTIQHWLPTREYSIIASYLRAGKVFPVNLTIRFSAYKVNGNPPAELAKRLGVLTSGVCDSSFTCPAPKQNNQCGNCRACWDKTVSNVNYKTH